MPDTRVFQIHFVAKKIRKKFQTRSNLDAFSGFLLLEGFFRIKSLEKTTN